MSQLSRFPILQSIYQELESLRNPSPPARLASQSGRDWHRVEWPGLGQFWLTTPQHQVVLILVEALFESRCPDVPQDVLVSAARVPARRLAEVFQGSSAWGVLVVPGKKPASYRMADLPSEEAA